MSEAPCACLPQAWGASFYEELLHRKEDHLTTIYHDLVILGGGPAGLTAVL